jgi:hypothetical protein
MPYFACFDLFSGNPFPGKQNHALEQLLAALVAGSFIGIAETMKPYLCSISACISHFHTFRDRN